MNKCPYCTNEYPTLRGLEVHKGRKHIHEVVREKELYNESKPHKCPKCDKAYDKLLGLQGHLARVHNIKGQESFMLLNNITEIPKCKCGCGQDVTFAPGIDGGFREFLHGHYVRTTGGFYTEEGVKKGSETRKKMWKTGELHAWNKGITGEEYLKHFDLEDGTNSLLNAVTSKERNDKISKALKGKPKSPEHIAKIQKDRKEFWSKQENRDKQRETRLNYIKEHGFNFKSKLEDIFKNMLIELNIKFESQFRIPGHRFFYDFKIKDKNILIEADGDFYHMNPDTQYKDAIYDCQKFNLNRDKLKNQIAEQNGYKLLRFWENDIKNHPAKVIKILQDTISEYKNTK